MTDAEGIRHIETLVEATNASRISRSAGPASSPRTMTDRPTNLAWLGRPFAEALHALEERARECTSRIRVTRARSTRSYPRDWPLPPLGQVHTARQIDRSGAFQFACRPTWMRRHIGYLRASYC